jgi:hypothetical protein
MDEHTISADQMFAAVIAVGNLVVSPSAGREVSLCFGSKIRKKLPAVCAVRLIEHTEIPGLFSRLR